MTTDTLLISQTDKVLTLSFNRAEKKNSLTQSMYVSAIDAITQAKDDPDVHVVLIRGEQNLFTAGNDLDSFNNRKPDEKSLGIRLLEVLHEFPKPIVAAVSGVAIGIGATMLLHCDLVYASPNTRFRLPFINLGLVPEGGSSLLLPLRIGHQRAAKVLMLGEFFDTADAINFGFVSEEVVLDQLYSKANETARVLSLLPQEALLTTKRLMKQSLAEEVSSTIEDEAQEFARMLQTPESRQLRSSTLKKDK